ncbi:hypothetical protein [Salinispora tropica]|uniref:hypothetical protein n=1 Tax=Salinispora tropica TaxID=168695 RepID=UPI001E298E4C|nr:hypothetical protein [Salinispora tropica]
MRVRFPSPAPHLPAQVSGTLAEPGPFSFFVPLAALRAAGFASVAFRFAGLSLDAFGGASLGLTLDVSPLALLDLAVAAARFACLVIRRCMPSAISQSRSLFACW